MLIIKTLAGDEIGRVHDWEGTQELADGRLWKARGYRCGYMDWHIEEVDQDDGYDRRIEFMTLDGRRYFVVEGK